jgi:hypothetical protein
LELTLFVLELTLLVLELTLFVLGPDALRSGHSRWSFGFR